MDDESLVNLCNLRQYNCNISTSGSCHGRSLVFKLVRYRPISLLIVCYRLFEKLLLNHISTPVNDLLKPYQAAFRKQKRSQHLRPACRTYNTLQKWLSKAPKNRLSLLGLGSSLWYGLACWSTLQTLDEFPTMVILVDLLLRDQQFRVSHERWHKVMEMSEKRPSTGLGFSSYIIQSLPKWYTWHC